MAKKEKLNIQKDKRMEPIDNELDAALGLLENANRQITDLLASFVPLPPGAPDDEAVKEGAGEAENPETKDESKDGKAASSEQ